MEKAVYEPRRCTRLQQDLQGEEEAVRRAPLRAELLEGDGRDRAGITPRGQLELCLGPGLAFRGIVGSREFRPEAIPVSLRERSCHC